jgi:SAM-dependent methyltransferase
VSWSWGHQMTFGNFTTQIGTYMRQKHLWDFSIFTDMFGFPKHRLSDLRGIDIGSYSGATSLMLLALGVKHVTAVEEVASYADCIEFIGKSYGVTDDRLSVERRSLFALDQPEFLHQYDFVLYPGVLYHVTDPVLSLRILFNALKPGGVILVETYATTEGQGKMAAYEGSHGPGNNFFLPNPGMMYTMLREVGFTDVQVTRSPRMHAVAHKPTVPSPYKMAGFSKIVC